MRVSKPFYSSGFVYHSPSGQILLQQNTASDTNLFLFRGKSHNDCDPQTVFQKCLENTLNIKIAPRSIHPIYDYIHTNLGEQFIFFAEVSDMIPKKYLSAHKTQWLRLSKISKYSMSEQTRHDIIIGGRVIRSLAEPHSLDKQV